MKTPERNHSTILTTSLLAAGVLAAFVLATGCKTTGYQKSDATALSMQSVADAIQEESHSLDVALASLKDLANSPKGDLKVQFAKFDTSLNNLIASEKKSQSVAQEMRKKGDDYFAAWNKQLGTISYEAVRKDSAARRLEAQDRFNAASRRFQESQSAVGPLISYLQDIRTALSTDLTVAGARSVASSVTKADESSTKIQGALAQISSELSNTGRQMSSITITEPKQVSANQAAQPSSSPTTNR
jgi:hypothetical protein